MISDGYKPTKEQQDALAEMIEKEISEDAKQHSGNPLDYAYGTNWHYYWTILDGGWTVARRGVDAKHPGNKWSDVANNPPEDVERIDVETPDPYG